MKIISHYTISPLEMTYLVGLGHWDSYEFFTSHAYNYSEDDLEQNWIDIRVELIKKSIIRLDGYRSKLSQDFEVLSSCLEEKNLQFVLHGVSIHRLFVISKDIMYRITMTSECAQISLYETSREDIDLFVEHIQEDENVVEVQGEASSTYTSYVFQIKEEGSASSEEMLLYRNEAHILRISEQQILSSIAIDQPMANCMFDFMEES